jgi:hypothetical protein
MIYNNQSLNNTKTNNKSQQHQQTYITHNNGSLKNTENNIKRIYDHNNQSLNNNNAPRPSNHSKNYNKNMNKFSPTTTKLHQQYPKFTPNLHQQQQ